MGNSIDEDIRMIEDVPSQNKDNKLPVLDTKMWVEEVKIERGGKEGKVEQIRYELYD